MLSVQARLLLGISPDCPLPSDLGVLYDGFFAGRSYETRFGEGWSFFPRGREIEDEFDFCLSHRTAPFNFCLDSDFRVYTFASDGVQIASNFISLVEEDAVLVNSAATGIGRRGYGTFPSYDAFFSIHGEYVAGWPEAPFQDESFGRFLLGPKSVIGLRRHYSDDYWSVGLNIFDPNRANAALQRTTLGDVALFAISRLPRPGSEEGVRAGSGL
jgi:hypothetical protein